MLVQRWRPLRRRGNNINSTSSAVCTFCSSLAKHAWRPRFIHQHAMLIVFQTSSKFFVWRRKSLPFP